MAINGSTGYTTLAQAQAAVDAANAKARASQKPVTPADQAQLAALVQKGDFANAWKYAASFGNAMDVSKAGTNPQAVTGAANQFLGNNAGTGNSPYTASSVSTANPLIQMLETPAGLQKLAPGMKWTPQSISSFYTSATPVWNSNILGKNSEAALWGDPTKLAADAASNMSQYGAMPDISRFGGMQPKDSFIDKATTIATRAAPVIALGVMTGGLGAALGPGVAAGATAGAAGGAATTAYGAYAADKPITLGGIGKGAAVGALTGGIQGSGIAKTGTGALTNMGVNPTIANGLVKGGIGAGIGAAGGALTGTGAGRGAVVGGVSGAAQGLAGSATGMPAVGQGAGILAGTLAGKYIAPAAPKPTLPAPAPAPVAQPAKVPAPVVAPPKATGTQGLPAPAPTTNLGSYSGMGYAPRTEVQNPVPNYATYGQGPEAQFFKPAGT